MELDELKQWWQQAPEQKQPTINIMDIIQHRSYGPLASLKRTYRKQMIVMAAFPFILLAANMKNIEGVLSSVLFWSYVAFCIGVILFAAYNYRIVKNMQTMDATVKTNLEQQVSFLEKRVQLELWGLRGVVLFFIVLLEVIPYFQHYRMLDKWHALPALTRIGVYAGFLVFQYFVSQRIKEKRVGRHIAYLKELMQQMQ